MIVSELIERLKQMPWDAVVYVYDTELGSCRVNHVEEAEGYSVVIV